MIHSRGIENSFSLYHVNVRSLPNKKNKLIEHFKSLKTFFRILGITETWLNENSIHYAELENYNSVHSLRYPGSIGGGASIYNHDSIDYTARDDISVNNNII